jgi:hypothetical protein
MGLNRVCGSNSDRNDDAALEQQFILVSLVSFQKQVACTYRQAKQSLGTGDDQRFAIISSDLPPKQMEVLRGGRRVSDMYIHVSE